jgi:hypothetical protein
MLPIREDKNRERQNKDGTKMEKNKTRERGGWRGRMHKVSV